jgi:hypothetical protein
MFRARRRSSGDETTNPSATPDTPHTRRHSVSNLPTFGRADHDDTNEDRAKVAVYPFHSKSHIHWQTLPIRVECPAGSMLLCAAAKLCVPALGTRARVVLAPAAAEFECGDIGSQDEHHATTVLNGSASSV